jgi:tetratricopeptide (TPR) repeat protein
MLAAQSLERRATQENTRKAEILVEQALSIDPNSAPAWALLGRIYYRQASLFRSRPLQEGTEIARQAIQRALSISPSYGPAHADLALINLTFDFDFDTAFQHLRNAQDTDPADPHVLRVAAKMEMTHAHVDHAVEVLERAVRVDPHSCMAHTDLGQAYYFTNRLDEAEAELERALQLNPDVVRAHYFLGLVRLEKHSVELALVAMDEEPDKGLRMAGLALVRYAMKYADSSDEALGVTTLSRLGPTAYRVATVYAFRGQQDEALDWLEAAYEQKDGELIYLLVDPLLANLRAETRWKRLVEQLELTHRI